MTKRILLFRTARMGCPMLGTNDRHDLERRPRSSPPVTDAAVRFGLRRSPVPLAGSAWPVLPRCWVLGSNCS